MAITRAQQRAAIKNMKLAARTNLFWQVHMAYNGRGPLQGMTTETAISYLHDLIEATPEKHLLTALWDLREKVIGKKGTKNSFIPETSAKTIPMHTGGDDDGPRAA